MPQQARKNWGAPKHTGKVNALRRESQSAKYDPGSQIRAAATLKSGCLGHRVLGTYLTPLLYREKCLSSFQYGIHITH